MLQAFCFQNYNMLIFESQQFGVNVPQIILYCCSTWDMLDVVQSRGYQNQIIVYHKYYKTLKLLTLICFYSQTTCTRTSVCFIDYDTLPTLE